MSLLDVQNLSVSFNTADGVVRAVQDLSYQVDAGKTLGIVGESGSGKSVSSQTVMGLTRGAAITGEVLFEGIDLLTVGRREMQSIRGAQIAMIFQDPLSSLHPQYKVGWQIAEMIRAHVDVGRKEARGRAVDLLGLVGIPQPDRRADDYPHQFSGGMRQRAMIAMALALNPRLLIADEPTTALDVTVQAQIMLLMKRLQEEFGTALVLITHDLGVIADIADEVLVMYAGRAVEQTARDDLFAQPRHPYTQGLIRSIPAYTGERERLVPIAGQPPSLINLPVGCSFRPRCPQAFERCGERPPLDPITPGSAHLAACWLAPTPEPEPATTARSRTAVRKGTR